MVTPVLCAPIVAMPLGLVFRSVAFGATVLLALILGYTAYAYWVFRGKVDPDAGYHRYSRACAGRSGSSPFRPEAWRPSRCSVSRPC